MAEFRFMLPFSDTEILISISTESVLGMDYPKTDSLGSCDAENGNAKRFSDALYRLTKLIRKFRLG